MAPHSSTLAWQIPWTEEPGRLQSMGSRRVRYDWEYTLKYGTKNHIAQTPVDLGFWTRNRFPCLNLDNCLWRGRRMVSIQPGSVDYDGDRAEAASYLGRERPSVHRGCVVLKPTVLEGCDVCLVSCVWLCDPMDCSPPGSSVHGDSPDKNTGVGCHAILQGIFLTQGSNPGLPHCRRILYPLSHRGSLVIEGFPSFDIQFLYFPLFSLFWDISYRQ